MSKGAGMSPTSTFTTRVTLQRPRFVSALQRRSSALFAIASSVGVDVFRQLAGWRATGAHP